jgi:hypothetical protein
MNKLVFKLNFIYKRSYLLLFLGVIPRTNRPSPNTASLDIITTNEPHVALTDAHYDRLEAILIEKIQTYVQGGTKIIDIFLSNKLILL